VPHLGVVTSHHDRRTLVVADIPGLFTVIKDQGTMLEIIYERN
jgi:GTPase involved in cell partitioning and DNA repair